ncbi:ankyrin repeat-containing domain protein [Aspergillus multicolor]|uniref:ankyrin repeat-containing domain protein n=1 Tax=Aspergillus multicolor TaxID=41759 RepID=UPI003CCD2285
MAGSTLVDLPDELLLQICEYLSRSTKSLAALSRTSRELHRVADPVLYSPCRRDRDRRLQYILQWAGRNKQENTMVYAMHWLYRAMPNKLSLGSDALISASGAGFTNIVQDLLAVGVPPDGCGGGLTKHCTNRWPTGRAPILSALVGGQYDIVPMLLEAGVSINHYDFITTYQLASTATSQLIWMRLLQSGLNVDITDGLGNTLLHYACRAGSITVAQLLIQSGHDPNRSDSHHEAPLSIATRSSKPGTIGCVEMIRLLLEYGARADQVCNFRGWYPLHVASSMANPEAVQLLLQYNANVKALRGDGLTALGALRAADASLHMHSANHDKREYEVARLLLEAGASVRTNERQTKALLRVVAATGNGPYCELLLDAWEEQAPSSLPPDVVILAVAATGNARELHHLLGLRAMHPRIGGRIIGKLHLVTPLMAAVKSRNEEAIDVALHHETLFDAQGSNGRTVFHEALADPTLSEEIIRLLLDKASDITHPDTMGDTPLVTATRHQPAPVVSMVLKRLHADFVKTRPLQRPVRRGIDVPNVLYDRLLSSVAGALEVAARENKVITALTLLHYLDKHGLKCDHSCQLLHIAISLGHELIALLIIRSIQTLENVDSRGFTPLIKAAHLGRASIVKALIDADLDLEAKSIRSHTALETAAAKKYKMCLEHLLQTNFWSPQASDKIPLLRLAATHGCVNHLNKWLSQLKKACAPSDYANLTGVLLILAAAHDEAEACYWLIYRGADIDFCDTRGRSAIAHAAYQNAAQSARVLVEAGCDVHLSDNSGKSPLQQTSSDEVVRILYEAMGCASKGGIKD